jgi:hypothetical protein
MASSRIIRITSGDSACASIPDSAAKNVRPRLGLCRSRNGNSLRIQPGSRDAMRPW